MYDLGEFASYKFIMNDFSTPSHVSAPNTLVGALTCLAPFGNGYLYESELDGRTINSWMIEM